MNYAISWIALTGLLVIGLGQINWKKHHRLVGSNATTSGRVIEVLPQAHGSVRYVFEAAGRAYSGQSQPDPKIPLVGILPGEAVTVYYDPTNPKVSTLANPKMLKRSEEISILLTGVSVSTFVIVTWHFGILFSRRRSHKNAGKN